jgi:DNA-directed RNA polymerase subunit RPC12/RpoP
MAWICKNCGHVNVDASYKCMQCSAERPEQVTKKITKQKIKN